MGAPFSPPSPVETVRAGWYPDPWAAGDLRWWDGNRWTVNVAHPDRARLPAWVSPPVVVGAVLVIPIVVAGAIANPWPFLLSLIPVALIAPALLWADRVEPEPRPAKLHAFLWGATISIVVAVVGEAVAYAAAGETFAMVVGAPVIEETMKGLAIVWALNRREVDGVMDGVIYAGWAGLGFAVVEDFAYFIGANADGALADVVIARALLTPFAHPLFTLWFGLALGRTVVSGRPWFSRAIWGWSIAVALHAAWNGALVLTAHTGEPLVVVAAALLFVGVLVGSGAMVVVVRLREERRLIGALATLPRAYGLPPEQVHMYGRWRDITRARRALPRCERRVFDRRHAVLVRLAALHARPNGIDPVAEARLRAEVARVFPHP